jgi:endonuclease YncB( thermonuclease family)
MGLTGAGLWQALLLLHGVLALVASAGASELWHGVVTHVVDGDTVYMQVRGQGSSVSVRLIWKWSAAIFA